MDRPDTLQQRRIGDGMRIPVIVIGHSGRK
jgi:hypothetical protein